MTGFLDKLPGTMSRALNDVWAERHRQITKEGWNAEHDNEHDGGQMVKAAIAYGGHVAALLGVEWEPGEALPTNYTTGDPPRYWPWERKWWKPKDPRRDLVRAAALIVAEIDRLDRLAANKS